MSKNVLGHSQDPCQDMAHKSFVRPPPAAIGEQVQQSSHIDVPVSISTPMPLLPFSHSPATLPHRVSMGSPSSSFDSPALRSSSIPPCEPRRMKNTPKGPTYLRRSLLAQMEESEEQLAQSKSELHYNQAPSSGIDLSSSESAREANLRRLVLKRKINITDTTRSTSPQQQTTECSTADQPPTLHPGNSGHTDPSTLPLSPSTSPVHKSVPASSSVVFPKQNETQSASELAACFITETIQAITSTSVCKPPPSERTSKPMSRPSTSTRRALAPPSPPAFDLAAKHEELLQNIAQSKLLMAELATAKTKQEKDRILELLRQKTRYVLSDHFWRSF
jgi:hypothetical protein